MGIYDGRHADLYDLFYASKPYAAEAGYLHDLLRRFSTSPAHRILDIACGTGSHAIELAKLGYDGEHASKRSHHKDDADKKPE